MSSDLPRFDFVRKLDGLTKPGADSQDEDSTNRQHCFNKLENRRHTDTIISSVLGSEVTPPRKNIARAEIKLRRDLPKRSITKLRAINGIRFAT